MFPDKWTKGVCGQSISVALVELSIENGKVVKALRFSMALVRFSIGTGRVVKLMRFSMPLVRFLTIIGG